MLVSVDELETYMGIRFTEKVKIAVAMILRGLQSEIEFNIKRPTEIGTFTDRFYLMPIGAELSPFYEAGYPVVGYDPYALPFTISLNNSPVVEIVSVFGSNVGTPSTTPTQMVAGVDFVHRPFGVDVLYGLTNYDSVAVTYRAGYAPDESETQMFKLMILRAAAREAQNMYDSNVGLKELETREMTVATVGFTDAEIRTLKNKKRKRI